MTSGIFILLGSNLGDKEQNLMTAKAHIEEKIGKIIGQSSIYQTAAWGKNDQPAFYNQVIELATQLKPRPLLEELLTIEQVMGRERKEKWGERLIDLDILYYHQDIIDIDSLKVPHPGIPERRFTLVPLVEIAPDFINPRYKKTNEELLKQCKDTLTVSVLS